MFENNQRQGSTRTMIGTEIPGEVSSRDDGTSSVFDIGRMPGFTSPEIATARTQQRIAFYKALRINRIPTDFLKQENDCTLRVRECRIRGIPLLSPEADNTPEVLGVEILIRTRASEKFCLRSGTDNIDRSKLILPPRQSLEVGLRFPVPYVEFSTKWEAKDRYISDAEAAELTGLNAGAISGLTTGFAVRVGRVVEQLCQKAGFLLIDFKIEVAIDPITGEFMLIDGISQDEQGLMLDGVWYGKNPLRNWFKDNHPDWFQALEKAKESHSNDPSKWPGYPNLPDQVKRDHEERHVDMANRLEAT